MTISSVARAVLDSTESVDPEVWGHELYEALKALPEDEQNLLFPKVCRQYMTAFNSLQRRISPVYSDADAESSAPMQGSSIRNSQAISNAFDRDDLLIWWQNRMSQTYKHPVLGMVRFGNMTKTTAREVSEYQKSLISASIAENEKFDKLVDLIPTKDEQTFGSVSDATAREVAKHFA